jgi:hypothetical protein
MEACDGVEREKKGGVELWRFTKGDATGAFNGGRGSGPGLPRGGRRGARNQQDVRPTEAGDSQHGVAARAGRKQGRGTRGLARGEGRTTGPMKNSDISELFKVFYI